MTTAELLAEIEANPFVNAIGTPVAVGTPNEFGDVVYQVGIRKRAKTLVNFELIRYVVLHQGTGADVACYLKTNAITFENSQEQFGEDKVIAAPVVQTP
jgi:hypothetical protein